MTTEQFESLKSALESGLIDKQTAEQIISKHEDKDIAEATKSARAHGRQIRTDLGLPQMTPAASAVKMLTQQTIQRY